MDETLSKLITCLHCGNIAKMQIIGNANENDDFVEENGYVHHGGITYSILKCPACLKTNIVTYSWNENAYGDEDITYEFLYPTTINVPIGLPEKIKKAYLSAERVKNTEVYVYAILMRRLLEFVCLDRNAEGKNLAKKLEYLRDNNEIPSNLVDVAKGLREFGNIGAHADAGELTPEEIPILSALCTAILEYVYSAPYLAKLAERKLLEIRSRHK